MIHCNTPEDQARQWNARRSGDKYTESTFDDLASRFEVPDSKNRWEQPLFRLTPVAPDLTSLLQVDEVSSVLLVAFCLIMSSVYHAVSIPSWATTSAG